MQSPNISNSNTGPSRSSVNESQFISQFQLKQQLQSAQQDTEIAKALFRRVLFLLSKEIVDVERVMKLLVKVVERADKARRLLVELVEANPSNTQIIRQLGVLLRDIEHSTDEAELLFVQANNIEDETSKNEFQQIEAMQINEANLPAPSSSPMQGNSQNNTYDSKAIFNILAQSTQFSLTKTLSQNHMLNQDTKQKSFQKHGTNYSLASQSQYYVKTEKERLRQQHYIALQRKRNNEQTKHRRRIQKNRMKHINDIAEGKKKDKEKEREKRKKKIQSVGKDNTAANASQLQTMKTQHNSIKTQGSLKTGQNSMQTAENSLNMFDNEKFRLRFGQSMQRGIGTITQNNSENEEENFKRGFGLITQNNSENEVEQFRRGFGLITRVNSENEQYNQHGFISQVNSETEKQHFRFGFISQFPTLKEESTYHEHENDNASVINDNIDVTPKLETKHNDHTNLPSPQQKINNVTSTKESNTLISSNHVQFSNSLDEDLTESDLIPFFLQIILAIYIIIAGIFIISYIFSNETFRGGERSGKNIMYTMKIGMNMQELCWALVNIQFTESDFPLIQQTTNEDLNSDGELEQIRRGSEIVFRYVNDVEGSWLKRRSELRLYIFEKEDSLLNTLHSVYDQSLQPDEMEFWEDQSKLENIIQR
ncbi:MAG: hypothetical protein EZS28_014471 [Streblomastix strix]|uniref:TmcB/TmcC TPR repeats domain-containing protein n=1 Tax=Streblomastix strix TaxID=222440 RepID=A0A5J4W5M0_9EUKA|nr:MAG: hypothetical protein EZS28_014471 [Streblomastix strix]